MFLQITRFTEEITVHLLQVGLATIKVGNGNVEACLERKEEGNLISETVKRHVLEFASRLELELCSDQLDQSTPSKA